MHRYSAVDFDALRQLDLAQRRERYRLDPFKTWHARTRHFPSSRHTTTTPGAGRICQFCGPRNLPPDLHSDCSTRVIGIWRLHTQYTPRPRVTTKEATAYHYDHPPTTAKYSTTTHPDGAEICALRTARTNLPRVDTPLCISTRETLL